MMVVLGAVIAGFVQGLTGSNFGLVAMGVWAWVLEPVLMTPLIVCGSITGHLLAARSLPWWRMRALLVPMLLGGLLGIPIGVWLLLLIDRNWFCLIIGLLLTCWCSMMLMARQLPKIRWGGRGANAFVGWLGGVLSGLGGLSGALPSLWAVFKGWDRETMRTVVQGFNLAMQCSTVVALLVVGALSGPTLKMLPAVIAGVVPASLLGMWLYRRLSDQLFSRVVLGLLSVSGLLLVMMSLPKLL